MARGEKLPSIDQTRYQLADDPMDGSNPQAWKKAIDQANINFQYAENQRMNLELEKEYGKQVWTAHIQQTEEAIAYTTR